MSVTHTSWEPADPWGHRESTSAREVSCYWFWRSSSPCSWSLQLQSDKHRDRFSVRVDHPLTNSTCCIQRGPERLQVHLSWFQPVVVWGICSNSTKSQHTCTWVRKRRVEILKEPCLGPVWAPPIFLLFFSSDRQSTTWFKCLRKFSIILRERGNYKMGRDCSAMLWPVCTQSSASNWKKSAN